MKRIIVFTVASLLLLVTLPVMGKAQPASTSSSPNSGSFTFYAIYDRLLDTDSHNVGLYRSAMSGDGTKLIFAGTDKTSGNQVLYRLNTDGTGLTQIPLPDLGGRSIAEVTIDRDGSLAYFRASSLSERSIRGLDRW